MCNAKCSSYSSTKECTTIDWFLKADMKSQLPSTKPDIKEMCKNYQYATFVIIFVFLL